MHCAQCLPIRWLKHAHIRTHAHMLYMVKMIHIELVKTHPKLLE